MKVKLSRARANSSLRKCSNKKAVPYKRWLIIVQYEIKYKNYRKYYKNVIREAEVNDYVLQFDTKFNSVKQIWHNINSKASLSKSKKKETISTLTMNDIDTTT